MKALFLLALLPLFWTPHSVSAQTTRSRTTTRDGLRLTLVVTRSGNAVSAQATVTNIGEFGFDYAGGCAPPLVRVAAYNADGNIVYGYKPPQVQCLAITTAHLLPGQTLTAQTAFTANQTVHVRAVIARMSTIVFRTRAITVRPR
jgi:hypothetical protein